MSESQSHQDTLKSPENVTTLVFSMAAFPLTLHCP